MADTMLQHFKVWVNLCVDTQTKQYTPITSAIPHKGLLRFSQVTMTMTSLLRTVVTIQFLRCTSEVSSLQCRPVSMAAQLSMTCLFSLLRTVGYYNSFTVPLKLVLYNADPLAWLHNCLWLVCFLSSELWLLQFLHCTSQVSSLQCRPVSRGGDHYVQGKTIGCLQFSKSINTIQ